MRINDTEFNASLQEILDELVSQLRANDIQYIQKRIDTSKDIQVCCPYHNGGMERKPSAGIRKSDGLFHCFACNEVHSLPEVISYCFGHENDLVGAFGWRWLVRNFSTVKVEERKDVELDLDRSRFSTRTSIGTATDVSSGGDSTNNGISDREYVREEELDSYRYIHPYMYERKLTDEIIELFDIGYDKNTRCITFPVRDIEGHCLFIARRSVDTKFFNYPQGVEKPVYAAYELYQLKVFPKEVYITESMLDCLYLWRFKKYACALNGLGTSSQFNILRRMPCRKFILATDNDKPGMKARDILRKKLYNKIVTEVIIPQGKKDINDCTSDEILNLKEVF